MSGPRDESDPLLDLPALPVLDLDPRKAREVRVRAVALLAARGRRAATRRAHVETAVARFVQPVLAAGLTIGFAAWVLSRSIGVLEQARGGFFWP